MNSLEELENSPDIQERKEYVRRMKLHLAKWESQLPEIKELDDGTTTILSYQKNKEAIKNLKTKLQNYGIYKQKFKCRTCQEVECICYELKRSTGAVPSQLQPSDENGQARRSNNLEALRGATGDHNSSAWSQEELNKLF